MANTRRALPEDLKQLLDLVQKGHLFALQEWIKAGKCIRVPEGPGKALPLLEQAIKTGFHSMLEELLRAGGWSPAELADAAELAQSRNRPDLVSLIQHYSTQSPSNGLSPRAKSCLTAAGIPLEKQAVLHALRTGALSWRTTLYGEYTHRDVCRWLGLDESFRPPITPEDTRPPFLENGLSYRANGVLHRAGIPADKSAVRQAIDTGALIPGKHPYNYGQQTHAELCRWVGVDPSAPRRQQ
jgi:hypothetical protein